MTDLIVPDREQPEPVHESSLRLARDLDEARSPELANRARRDEFNDFFSTNVAPQALLRSKLLKQMDTLERAARRATREDRHAMMQEARGLRLVYQRALRGRYVATRQEAELWAQHEDRILAARKTP